ncbi:MAG: hypothetical protein U9R56_04620 [candidate division Zixibacteria bacterium]|nr:hypothetical protein [candidate division Zixibacteria bacterium]
MKRTAAILLSRQPLRPTGVTPWVRQTVAAVRWLKNQGFAVVTSTGMQTWELITALSAHEGLSQKIVIPAVDDDEYDSIRRLTAEQFDLRDSHVEYVPLQVMNNDISRHDLMLQRDMTVIDESNLLVPVSIRDGGHMDQLLEKVHLDGKPVEQSFQVKYKKRDAPLAYNLSADNLNRDIIDTGDKYLTHWTRTANSAWPTERTADYYLAITESDVYPRNAPATLLNIISGKRITASARHMPGNIPTVSFSGLPPKELIPLIRWRARFSQMSFEPYGIGIEKEEAVRCGVQPVRYYNTNGNRNSRQSQSWLWQSVGQKSDWRQEREYRHKGDFDLAGIPTDKLVCFCHHQREAERITNYTGLRAISFIP